MTRRLVARLDHVGDVLLAGPAIRAVAASGAPVDLLAGPAGASAGALLPGVERVLTVAAPWVGDEAPAADAAGVAELVHRLQGGGYDEAIVLTSFHQSPLPMALVLRMAGVRRISATCVDHPGSLLDLRHPYRAELHEVEQALDLCAAAGHRLPDGDDGALQIRPPQATHTGLVSRLVTAMPPRGYVVVHPGASVPSRALPLQPTRGAVAELARAGLHVVITGGGAEHALVEQVAADAPPGSTTQLAGSLDLAQLAEVLRGAAAVVCGNTGPAHLAAAVGTPVVQAFAPVVPVHRWRPWGVRSVQLGDGAVACRGCRARRCPLPGQPCLAPYTPAAVLAAVDAVRERLPRSLADVGGVAPRRLAVTAALEAGR